MLCCAIETGLPTRQGGHPKQTPSRVSIGLGIIDNNIQPHNINFTSEGFDFCGDLSAWFCLQPWLITLFFFSHSFFPRWQTHSIRWLALTLSFSGSTSERSSDSGALKSGSRVDFVFFLCFFRLQILPHLSSLLPRALFVEYFDSDLIAYATKKKYLRLRQRRRQSFHTRGKATNARYAAHKPPSRAAQGNPTAGNL